MKSSHGVVDGLCFPRNLFNVMSMSGDAVLKVQKAGVVKWVKQLTQETRVPVAHVTKPTKVKWRKSPDFVFLRLKRKYGRSEMTLDKHKMHEMTQKKYP